jgi:hypothetical protein
MRPFEVTAQTHAILMVVVAIHSFARLSKEIMIPPEPRYRSNLNLAVGTLEMLAGQSRRRSLDTFREDHADISKAGVIIQAGGSVLLGQLQ